MAPLISQGPTLRTRYIPKPVFLADTMGDYAQWTFVTGCKDVMGDG